MTHSLSDESNVYYHVNRIHDFFKGSPFYFSEMDYQMVANIVNWDINGQSNGTDIWIGTQDDQYWARSSDLIYHEYTHNVIYHIYSGFIGDGGCNQATAMDEGFADYFASTLNNDSRHCESCGGTRDLSNSYSWDSQADDCPHWNGQVIGGACWDLRQDLGASYVNELVFDALDMPSHRAYNFEDFALNICVADDDDGNLYNGCPHYNNIKTAFETNHGIPVTLPIPPPLYVTITGPTYLQPSQVGTFIANPSGGSGSYTNYRWWKRNDGGSVPKSMSENQLSGDGGLVYPMLPPEGVWIELTTWEGYKTIQQSFPVSFSLKCRVYDSNNYTAEDIHSVYVPGGGGPEPDIRKPCIDVSLVPSELILESNYPNPCNPSTTINFGLPETQHLEISVYSLTGQKVITLVNGIMQGGYHQVKWDGRDSSGKQVTSGIYIYQINSVGKRLVRKMVLTK